MRPIIKQKFFAFSEPFEGRVSWMYLDVKGYVTIGVGNLIDPISYAIDLPFLDVHGSPASKSEIGDEWTMIKHHPDLARLGHRAAVVVAKLRLPNDAIDRLVLKKLDEMNAYLLGRFPEFENWPACAQLAVLSMSWAMGPAFRYPKLHGALLARDWPMAANECWIKETGNFGVHPRNIANRFLFLNANTCQPDELVWQRRVDSEPDTVPDVMLNPLDAIEGIAELSKDRDEGEG